MTLYASGESDPEWISAEELVEHVRARLGRPGGQPAFALLVGAGFSVPVIPTAKQMVLSDIPWWLYRKEARIEGPFGPPPAGDPGLARFQEELWASIGCVPDAADAGSVVKAYQALMSARSVRGLSDARLRREYVRDVGRRAGNKINAAHLYLASILRAQDEGAWGGREALCRTVFTTNFDPLLQRALQLVGKLYYMTDSPLAVELPDDADGDAIHLVYCHGSLHRPILLNTETEISSARAEGALVPYLERRGLIVVGYSGWHDVMMRALLQCRTFDGNLYWCGLCDPEEAKTRLSREVLELLRRHRDKAFYVQIPGADALMTRLHAALGLGDAPWILDPRQHLIRSLESLEVSSAGAWRVEEPLVRALLDQGVGSMARQDWGRAKEDFAAVLRLHGVPEDLLAQALLNRAACHLGLGDSDAALEDCDRVVRLSGASAEARAQALYKQGVVYWMRRNAGAEGQRTADLNVSRAIESYSAAVQLAEAPADLRARCLHNRGLCHDFLADFERALSDYGAVIDMPGVPPETRASALAARGWALFRQDRKKAAELLRDTTAALEIDPSLASARLRRGLALLAGGGAAAALAQYEDAVDATPRLLDSAVAAILELVEEGTVERSPWVDAILRLLRSRLDGQAQASAL